MRVGLFVSSAAALFVAAALVFVAPARAGGEIEVVLNEAKVLQLPPNATTIIVGNPVVADVTMVRGSNQMVLTGKGFGRTNLIALDSRGRSVGESIIRVRASGHGIVVQRGMNRETWDCSPRCEPTMSLGDTTAFSNDVAAQIQARNSAARGGGGPSSTMGSH